MRPPCEVIVSRFLPQLRASIVKTLTEEYKLKQTDIAEKLGVTQSAVSLYLLSGRGEDTTFFEMFPELQEKAANIAKAVFEGKNSGPNAILQMCSLCTALRKSTEFCAYHRKVARIEGCEVCNEVLK